jgi:hypothetical protein
MPLVTPETVKQVLKDVHDYEISDEAAGPVANTAGAMISLAHNLDSLGLDDLEPPFGFPNLMAGATRIAAKK